MKEEALRTDHDRQLLMHWAAACKKLTARMLGGLDALFIAATEGTNTALPPAMITDSEVHACVLHGMHACRADAAVWRVVCV